ncbi:hypothetical protein PSM7751_02127 [Pseudooceanicola marinus]|uniref:DUF2852 domain-containing protein n=1 Tax=Pseudooceanicola marinus TaxID=396013 RepID=A0A1X6ZB80_9RHOB|nr:DUF2852 domain-containing protein [Pseudooceanicola marinus]PJE28200.1 DUF2852 domain-containing protein [Pseudooceanicola marinus]SLN46089.1 hypothetical protein PSM7751_02127 [Pseudooceanicola marinus]
MTTATYSPRHDAPQRRSWLGRTEDWLDSKGKGAWIAAMVLGFIFFWPIGLAILFYMIWGKQMFGKSCRNSRARDIQGHMQAMRRSGYAAMRPSGNSAFDAYKEETLRRLEDEQEQFEAFLERLRAAKDKAEFDEFMDERADRARAERDAVARSGDDNQAPKPYAEV